ncbi:MAG: beta-hydroxyacyl-ACP dehydratase [Planctomycetia bacterium]|nr:beta-hydroxyacyl-ACP dehydratase [Planctomycetia bacterium]
MSLDEIHAAIPHRAPFLFVDEIVARDEKRIVCRKTFRESDWFYSGHYPYYPITPGVLLCEAAMQAGAILLAQFEPSIRGGVPVAARMNDVRFKRVVKPGETIEMEVELTHRVSKAFYLTAKVMCGGKVAVRFEFTCAMASMT